MVDDKLATARYRVLKKCFGLDPAHPRMHQPGEEINTELPPGPHLEPLNGAAKKAYRETDVEGMRRRLSRVNYIPPVSVVAPGAPTDPFDQDPDEGIGPADVPLHA